MAMDHEMAERTDCRTLWKSTKYDKKAVEKIYCHLKDGLTDPHLLESTYYLEKYLLPFYDSKSSKAHILSILAVFNEKLRLGLRSFEMLSEAFPSLFGKSLDFFSQGTIFEQNIVLQFLNHTFTFMDIGFVKTECVKIVNISCWKSLVSQEALEDQLSQSPDRQKLWDKAEKRFAAGKYIFIVASGSSRERLIFEHGFLSHLIKNFLKQLYSFDGALLSLEVVSYIEAVLEFMLTLLSQLSTRRHFIVLFQDHLVMPLCIRSGFLRKYNEQNTLACQLMKLLSAYASFGVDDITGLQQSAEEVAQIRNERIVEMQKLAFMNMRSELELFVFASASTLKDAKSIRGTFEKCSDDVIVRFCDLLKIRTLDVATGTLYPREFLIEFIVWNLKTHETQFDWINSEPLYPDEVMIFDDTRVPSLALQKPYKSAPILKLTAQYLTIGDYLLRNFVMYKSEYAYALRKDIQEAVLRLSPSFNLDGTSLLDRTLFRGWSRNAIPVEQFQIDQVGPPRLSEVAPTFVIAELLFNIEKYAPNIKDSWDNLKPNDNLYLLGIQMEADVLAATDKSLPTTGDGYKKKFGIKYIRGCQVHELLDDQGAVVLDYKVAQVLDEKGQAPIVGGSRTMRVLLDPNQYLADSKACKDIYDVYGCLNIVLKRSSDSNFYKSILETLRGLISSDFVFPDWLSNTLLGYKSKNATLTDSESGRIIGNTYDTILDWKHLQSSFPDVVLCFKLENNQQKKP